MTPAILRKTIEDALGAVPFEMPLTLEYKERVMAELKRLQPGAKFSVYGALVVEAWVGEWPGTVSDRFELKLPA